MTSSNFPSHGQKTVIVEQLFSQLSLQSQSDKVEAKKKIRVEVWTLLESEGNIRSYPVSCHDKIPNFKGSQYANKKVRKLKEFQDAKVIKSNPSLAQMELRFDALKSHKILLVPSPSLMTYTDENKNDEEEDKNFFYMLDGSEMSDSVRKIAMTKKGSISLGKPLSDDWSTCPHIDLYIVGSVAVTESGRRLGKGLGYAELEWGILYELGVVDQSTIVLTTVHENQIVSDSKFPSDLQQIHDLPVDLIVTPHRIINVRPKPLKPSQGILWSEIQKSPHLKSLPIIKLLQKS